MPQLISLSSRKNRELASRALPFQTYLFILNQAVCTGKLVKVDHTGQATGEVDDLRADQRIDLMKFAMNKFLPDAPKEVEESAMRLMDITSAKEVHALTTDKIRELLVEPDPEPAEEPQVPPEMTAKAWEW